MRIKNLIIRSQDDDRLRALREEYRDYCGYDTHLSPGRLIVFAVPRSARRKQQRKRQREYTGAS